MPAAVCPGKAGAGRRTKRPGNPGPALTLTLSRRERGFLDVPLSLSFRANGLFVSRWQIALEAGRRLEGDHDSERRGRDLGEPVRAGHGGVGEMQGDPVAPAQGDDSASGHHELVWQERGVSQLLPVNDVHDLLVRVLVALAGAVNRAGGDADAEDADLLARQIYAVDPHGPAGAGREVFLHGLHGGLVVRVIPQQVHVLEVRHEHAVVILTGAEFLRRYALGAESLVRPKRGLERGRHAIES